MKKNYTFIVTNPCFNIKEVENELQLWLHTMSENYNYNINELQYVFCDDKYLIRLNKQYLNHNTYTDILSFQYNKTGESIEGEIYISIDRVRDNAIKYHKSFNDEVLRVMAHGILHMFGYRDKKEEDISVMRKEENRCIDFASSILRTSRLLS